MTRRGAFAAFLLLLAAALGACREEGPVQETVLRPVRTHAVVPASTSQTRRFPGRSQPGTEAALSFKVSGQLQSLDVAVGSYVQKDQVIAELDVTDLRRKLRQAEAAYAQARAEERNALSTYDRTQILYEKQSVSVSRLDADRAKAESAKATRSDKAQAVELARAQIDYAKLRAPADGWIAAVPVNVNENVDSGETIASLNFGVLPKVAFNAPGNLIGLIQRGQPATVEFDDLEGRSFPAEIVEVGVAGGRTAFPVAARLSAADDAIRPGMACDVTLSFDLGQDAADAMRIYVPASAVAEDADGRFVYVADGAAGGTATIARRDVTIGKLAVPGLEIVEGLSEGDQVITAGIRFVQPGMTVRVLPD